jgi:pyruvate dehydrogenase E2 component (dihydrolipoamide acetyltransferase)
MAAEIIMPKLGLTMTEGTVDTWLKNEGDAITKGEVVCTISSEKLTHDVEATESGKLIQILVQAGEDAPCQAPIGLIGAEGEDVTDTEEKLDTQDKEGKNDEINEQSSAEKERQKDTSLQTDAVKKEGARFFITPLARKIAKEKGVDYTQSMGLEETDGLLEEMSKCTYLF